MKKFILLLILVLGSMVIPQDSHFTNSYLPKMNTHLINKEFSLNLPYSMQIQENLLEEKELLLYSAYINDEHYALRGYLQVWQLQDLEGYLQRSKEKSAFDFYTYSLNPTEVKGFQGYVNSWGASFGEMTKISGKEYWLKTPQSKVLRLAFLTSKTSFDEEQLKIIHHILASINRLGE